MLEYLPEEEVNVNPWRERRHAPHSTRPGHPPFLGELLESSRSEGGTSPFKPRSKQVIDEVVIDRTSPKMSSIDEENSDSGNV